MASPPDGYLGLKGFDTSLVKSVEPLLIQVANYGLGVSLVTSLASERNVGTANAYGVAVGEWTALIFNPRGASTGTTLGTAGTAGATEVLVSSVPVLVGGFIFQGDSTAAKGILLRDTTATGNSIAAVYIAAGLVAPNAGATDAAYYPNGWKTVSGLTICGEAAGVSGLLLYRPI